MGRSRRLSSTGERRRPGGLPSSGQVRAPDELRPEGAAWFACRGVSWYILISNLL
jgi:hypothetical protein